MKLTGIKSASSRLLSGRAEIKPPSLMKRSPEQSSSHFPQSCAPEGSRQREAALLPPGGDFLPSFDITFGLMGG